jgi:hypothetical protein
MVTSNRVGSSHVPKRTTWRNVDSAEDQVSVHPVAGKALSPQREDPDMKRLLVIASTIAVVALAIPAGAASSQFPDIVPLPDGIAPEGIVSGGGTEFYVGSLADGTIYKGDFRTASGDFINDSSDFQSARVAVGLDYDARSNTVWVAGGPTGSGYVYDGDTGETISVLTLASSASTFVNDVVVTRDTAYFTESFQAVIYAADLDRRGFPTGEVGRRRASPRPPRSCGSGW